MLALFASWHHAGRLADLWLRLHGHRGSSALTLQVLRGTDRQDFPRAGAEGACSRMCDSAWKVVEEAGWAIALGGWGQGQKAAAGLGTGSGWLVCCTVPGLVPVQVPCPPSSSLQLSPQVSCHGAHKTTLPAAQGGSMPRQKWGEPLFQAASVPPTVP